MPQSVFILSYIPCQDYEGGGLRLKTKYMFPINNAVSVCLKSYLKKKSYSKLC